MSDHQKFKNKAGVSLDSESWIKIQDEIRQKVFEKEDELKNILTKEQVQEINLQVLEEMTDVLSREEIDEIAKQVNQQYTEAASIKSGIGSVLKSIFNPIIFLIDWIQDWLNINKTIIMSIIITASICYIAPQQFEGEVKEQIYGAMIFFFPFVIILFGIIYALLSAFKSKK